MNTADGSILYTIDFDPGTVGGNAISSAAVAWEVPEPATLSILLLGSIMSTRRRRS